MLQLRKSTFSKLINRIQQYKPYSQKAPDCYFDLPKIEQRTDLQYAFQEKYYKSIIPIEKVYCDEYEDENFKRKEGYLYEASILASLDNTWNLRNHYNEQCYCTSTVNNISIVNLNVGEDLYGNQQRLKANMIEELLIRSDADFICLQNVPESMFKQWLESQTLIRHYSFSFDKKSQYRSNVVITKWPSYVYEMPLTEDNTKSLILVEPVNGINGQPILIANANLDQGILKKAPRLHQLYQVLNSLNEFGCENVVLARNYDLFSSQEEKELINQAKFIDIESQQEIIYEKLNVFAIKQSTHSNWNFDEIVAFGACASPQYWRQEAGLSIFDDYNKQSNDDLGVICSFNFLNTAIKKDKTE